MNINQPLFINQMYDPVLYICRRDNFRTDEKKIWNNSHSFLYKRLGTFSLAPFMKCIIFVSLIAKPAVLINGFFSFWIFTWRVLFIYSLRVLYIYRFFFFYIHVLCYYIQCFFFFLNNKTKKIQTFLYPPLRKTWKFI